MQEAQQQKTVLEDLQRQDKRLRSAATKNQLVIGVFSTAQTSFTFDQKGSIFWPPVNNLQPPEKCSQPDIDDMHSQQKCREQRSHWWAEHSDAGRTFTCGQNIHLHVIAAAIFLRQMDESLMCGTCLVRSKRTRFTSIGLVQRGQLLVISWIHDMLACSSSRRTKYLGKNQCKTFYILIIHIFFIK